MLLTSNVAHALKIQGPALMLTIPYFFVCMRQITYKYVYFNICLTDVVKYLVTHKTRSPRDKNRDDQAMFDNHDNFNRTIVHIKLIDCVVSC